MARPFYVLRRIASPFVFLLIANGLSADPLPGYYDPATGLSGSSLKTALHQIIDDHQRFPYTSTAIDTWNILEQADEDPGNSANVLDVYKNHSFPKPDHDGTVSNGWNREHVWPKSYGFPDDLVCNYPYTDCHHLMACDAGYNSSRNNNPFDFCPGGNAYPVEGTTLNNYILNGMWEVWDNRKGDVARAILYMDVRYEGGNHGTSGCAEPDLRLTDDPQQIVVTSSNATVGYMGMLSTLLAWHLADPVDANERSRNDLVFTYQLNRNPFIDHPEYVCAIYGGECSGGGGDTTPPAAPVSLVATGSNGSVALDWSNNTESDLAGYNVYRSTTNGSNYSQINGTLLGTSAYIDSVVSNGTTYYYVVTAVDSSDNESSFSNQASATPTAPPPTIVINEALPAPSSGNEWVELYNTGTSTINLAGWKIDDIIGGGSSPVTLSGTIAPGAFFVQNFSSAILNNTGDPINLIDAGGNVVDSTSYGSAPVGSSWARNPNATGPFSWDATPSPGQHNQIVSATFTAVAAEDGYVLESGENTNVGGSISSAVTTIRVGDDNTRKQFRSIVSFNTSALPDGAVITGATLKLTRSSVTSKPWQTLGSLTVDINGTNFGASSALGTDDFSAASSASGVATVPEPSGNGATVQSILNSGGAGYVNKTGNTQLRLRFTTDDDNDSTNDYISFHSGEATTAAYRPELVIEYAP